MSALPATTAPKPVKRPRLSKKLKRAIDLWLTGRAGTRKDAASKVGLSEDYFGRALKRAPAQSYLRARAEQNITDATIRASSRVGELLDGESEHVAGKMALRLLESDRLISPQGVGAAVQINNFGRAGFCIDWSNDRDGPRRELTAEEEEELARSGGAGIVRKPLIGVTPEAEGDA